MATNWYNYGHCLEMVKRYQDAAAAFLKVADLEPEDGGAYLRACLALDRVGDAAALLQVFRRICLIDPGMISDLKAEPEFAPYFLRPEFQQLVREFGGG